MATGAAPKTQSGPPVASASTATPERYIDEQLARTRQHIRWMDVASGIVGWLTSLAGFLLAAALFDHWIAPLSTAGRWLALLVMIGMTGVAFWRWILPPLVLRVNPAYAAKVIEQRGERLHNSLINYLFLRASHGGVPDAVYQSLERRAAVDLEHVPWEQVMDHSRTFRWTYVLAGVLAVCAAYKILSPKDPLQTVARVLSPWADLARPSRVELRDIQPGDTKTFHGRPLLVSADVRGLRSGEVPRVVYATSDGQTVNEAVPMQLSADGLRFEATVPPGREGVRQNLTYRLEAGDALSRDFHVEVLPAPTIVIERVEFEPPRYTGIPRSVIEHQGDIRGLEGTKVTIHARASLPIKSAFIEFDPLANGDQNASPDASRILHLTVDGTQAKQSFVLQMKADRSGAWHESYQVRFVTPDEIRSEAPIVHSLAVQPDLPPEIEFLAPRQAEVTLRANQNLPLEIRAIDPDFGIARLTLRGERAGMASLEENLLDDAKGVPGQVVAKYLFSPKKLQLQPGDEISLSAEVADNRVDWKLGRPAPNTQRTSIVKVRIVAGDDAAATKEPADPGQPEPEAKPNDAGAKDANDPPSTPQKQPMDSGSPSEKPNQKPGQKPKQDSKQNPQDKTSAKDQANSGDDAPGDQQNPSDKPGDKSSEKPGQKPGSKPSDKPGDQPGDMPSSDKPGDKPGDQPESKPSEKPGDSPNGKPSEKPSGDPQSKQSPNEANGESKPPKPGKTQSGDPKQSGAAADGKGDKQDGGKGQGGASGSQSPKPNDPPSGAESSDPGNSSDNSNPSNNANSPNDSNPSNSPGQSTGKPGNSSAGSPGGEGSGEGQPTGELHDGDVFQKALEHMKARQGGAGKPAGKPGEQSTAKPEGPPAGKPSDEASQGDRPSGTDNQSGTPGKPVPGKPSPGQPAAKPPASADNQENKSGEPMGGTETKPETPPREGERPQGKSPGAGTGQNGQSGAGESPEKPNGGSPSPITKPMDRPKSQSPDNKQAAGGDETPTPSESKKQSDSKGGAGGDRAGGGKQGGGQGAKQAGNDSAGGSSPGDEGNGAAPEQGKGPDGTKGGQGKPTEKPTGTSSGDQRGPGSSNAPGEGTKPNPSGNSPMNPDGSSPRVPSTGGGKAGGTPGGGPTQAGEVPEGDEANLDYARKSTDLVLDYLKDQQETPDSELLNKLGWSPDDLRKFLDRWQQLKQAADRQDPQARHELDESLKSLGLRTGRTEPRAGSAAADSVRGNRDDGQRSKPPARYIEQFKAYRKGTSRTEVQGK